MIELFNPYPKPRFLAVVVILMGLVLLGLGVELMSVGGSFYYVIAGSTLVICGVMLFRGDDRSAPLYGLFLFATFVWAVSEVGLDPWALMPRLAMFCVLGLWFLLPRVRAGLLQTEPELLFRRPVTQISMTVLAAFVASLFIANSNHDVGLASAMGSGEIKNTTGDWSHYGATKAGTRFAGFNQINLDNVSQLERGWEYRTRVPGTFKGTPIQIGDGLFLCTGQNIVIALDPDSGEERWRFDPEIKTSRWGFWDTCRGVTYYKVPEETPSAVCPERIFTATTDARLVAVDMQTGERCSDFGTNGEISLLPGMGKVKSGFYFVTSPPTIASGALVLGG